MVEIQAIKGAFRLVLSDETMTDDNGVECKLVETEIFDGNEWKRLKFETQSDGCRVMTDESQALLDKLHDEMVLRG